MAGKNLFNAVKMYRPGRNVFDLSHDVKLTCDMGLLVPTMNMECVPGDKINIGCDSLVRFAPMVAPVMHRVDVSMHYFFIPTRLLWSNWEKFITNTLVGGSLPAVPYLTVQGIDYTKLDDYLNLPNPGNPYEVNAFVHAAYQMVYNEYYRDQNLSAEVDFALVDGDNNGNTDLRVLRRRAWEHDYFTAALPFAQKGAAVDLPIGAIEENVTVKSNQGGTSLAWAATNTPLGASSANVPTGSDPAFGAAQLYAETDGLQVGSTTINDLRRAFRLQEWLEKAARGGSRYIESILAHFGVKSSDKRLQRPEYITGTKSPVIISEVLNTDGNSLPQGNMAGHGISVQAGKYGGYYCEEHGYVIGVMSVMPKTAYQQGIPKHFLKKDDPFQFYWPEFAHIGEQEVLNKEVYVDHTTPNNTFGYVPRYAEYKFMQNRVAGEFKTTLDYWHIGRIFSSDPNLNQAFIECNPDDRIFAVPTGDNIWCHVLHKINAVRPMPKFGTPTF